jgi:hypothetical protein
VFAGFVGVATFATTVFVAVFFIVGLLESGLVVLDFADADFVATGLLIGDFNAEA